MARQQHGLALAGDTCARRIRIGCHAPVQLAGGIAVIQRRIHAGPLNGNLTILVALRGIHQLAVRYRGGIFNAVRQILIQVGGLTFLPLAEHVTGKPHIGPHRGNGGQIQHPGSERSKQHRHTHEAEHFAPERRLGPGRNRADRPGIVRPMIYGHPDSPLSRDACPALPVLSGKPAVANAYQKAKNLYKTQKTRKVSTTGSFPCSRANYVANTSFALIRVITHPACEPSQQQRPARKQQPKPQQRRRWCSGR